MDFEFNSDFQLILCNVSELKEFVEVFRDSSAILLLLIKIVDFP